MWTYEHTVDTVALPTAIWRLWSDVPNWDSWNVDIEAIKIGGPFAAGTEILMTPGGQDPVRLRLSEVREPALFVDEAEFDGLVLRTVHRLERLDERRHLVTYRMEITGAAADEVGPRIGPAVTADWPATMAALVARAEGGDGGPAPR
ncbi:MAG: polyketide cyclase [Actinomycetota bacterium]|nr:polyketide cyclase [Actinomycetota bacterium]